jgi:hypothetical protein
VAGVDDAGSRAVFGGRPGRVIGVVGPQQSGLGAGVGHLGAVLPASLAEVVGEVAGGTHHVLPPLPGTWLGAAAAIRW